MLLNVEFHPDTQAVFCTRKKSLEEFIQKTRLAFVLNGLILDQIVESRPYFCRK